MNRLLWCEVAQNAAMPDFGDAFRAHIHRKKHTAVHAASLSAWALLALALRECGYDRLPTAAFSDTGKPYFANCDLHFSLSHSGNLAAVALSFAPCAVDVEAVRPQVEDRLLQRCLSPQELAAGCDFFDVWTKKECIAKLDGRGMPGQPCRIDTLDGQYESRFFTRRIFDSAGKEYALAALGGEWIGAEKRAVII